MFRYVLVLALLCACQDHAESAIGLQEQDMTDLFRGHHDDGHTFTVAPSGGDDTTAIQAAFDAAIAAGPGSRVELLAGQFHTNAIRVADYNGTFTGAGQDPDCTDEVVEGTCVDVLRVIDPDALVSKTPRAGGSGSTQLFEFFDSAVTISDLTFEITHPEPAEPWNWVGEEGEKRWLTMVLWLGGTTHSRVKRVTIRGHDNPDLGFNIECGISMSTSSVFGEVLATGDFSVTDNAMEHVGVPICVDATDSRVDITANDIDDAVVGIYVGTSINSVFDISYNQIRRPSGWGIWVIQGGHPHLPLYVPIFEPSGFLISSNTIEENAGTADGIGLEDWSNFSFGQPSIQALVVGNEIAMDTIYGGIYAVAVEDGLALFNVLSGHMMAGIYLAPYSLFYPDDGVLPSDRVPDWALLGNDVQGVVPTPGALAWIPPAKIYLGPGTSDTLAVVESSDDVTDDGADGTNTVIVAPWWW